MGATNLEIGDVKLVVGGQVVGTSGGHHHVVPGLLACLLSRRRDQPKLCHVYSAPPTSGLVELAACETASPL